jgi:hypothetical protein
MDKIQKTIGTECYIPSSETFGIYKIYRLKLFEIGALTSMFELKREEVLVRKLSNEQLSGLYFLQNIIWVIKSWKMQLAGNVVRVRDRRVLVGEA